MSILQNNIRLIWNKSSVIVKRNPMADSSSPPSWIETYCHVLTYNFNINACVHNVKTEMLQGIRFLTSPIFLFEWE